MNYKELRRLAVNLAARIEMALQAGIPILGNGHMPRGATGVNLSPSQPHRPEASLRSTLFAWQMG